VVTGAYFIWKIGNGKTFNQAIDDLKSTNTPNKDDGYFPPKNVDTKPKKEFANKDVLAVNDLGYNEMPYLMNINHTAFQEFSIDPNDIFSNNKVLTVAKY